MLKPRQSNPSRPAGSKADSKPVPGTDGKPAADGLFSRWLKPKPKQRVILGASGKTERSAPLPEQKTAQDGTTAKAPKPKRKSVQISVGPVTILITLAGFLAVGAWAVFATSTILFGDRLSARLIAQQSDMQFAYEQKLIVFRAQLDRIAQQARSDKTDVESRLTDLMLRQAQLEARQGMLLQLAGEGANVTQPGQPGTPAPPQRRGAAPQAEPFAVLDSSVPPHARLDEVEKSIVRLEAVYANVADSFVVQSRVQVSALQGTLTELGVDLQRIIPPPRPTGIPLPKSLTSDLSPFESGLAQARRSYGDLGRLRQLASAMPLLRPVNAIRMSSPFGTRVHPIYRTERLHAGMDFATPEGTPIRASGSGVVQSAGWGGGYGNLLVIDHGNGVTSRYAHLNEFLVQQGQPVAAGQVIAKSGNTGASTGPHLHYETRVRGEPKDPSIFMSVGERMGLPAS
jgi:murein DD-endopeptidase MepM/ murein hydrolase activator NlpD